MWHLAELAADHDRFDAGKITLLEDLYICYSALSFNQFQNCSTELPHLTSIQYPCFAGIK